MSITIGTFNVKDSLTNRSGGIRSNGCSNAEVVANKLKQFDVLGIQEGTVKYISNIQMLAQDYRFYGNYRYGSFLSHMPFNENNHIITNQKVIFEKTFWLPWTARPVFEFTKALCTGNAMPRIATVVVVEDEKQGTYCMINTHLDYKLQSVQIRQLKAIKELVEQYGKEYPIILTGDFNMEVTESHFQDFVGTLKKQGIQRADANEPTWRNRKGNAKTLDHIFTSREWQIEEAYVDHDVELALTSDHAPVIVKANRK